METVGGGGLWAEIVEVTGLYNISWRRKPRGRVRNFPFFLKARKPKPEWAGGLIRVSLSGASFPKSPEGRYEFKRPISSGKVLSD